jgi:hypothetical protein
MSTHRYAGTRHPDNAYQPGWPVMSAAGCLPRSVLP